MTRADLKQQLSDAIDSLQERSLPFAAVMVEAMAMHAKKSRDYGLGDDPYANVRASEEFGIPAWKGALIRANDKVTRLKTHSRGSALANESAEDSMLDLVVYFTIVLMLHRESVAASTQQRISDR